MDRLQLHIYRFFEQLNKEDAQETCIVSCVGVECDDCPCMAIDGSCLLLGDRHRDLDPEQRLTLFSNIIQRCDINSNEE